MSEQKGTGWEERFEPQEDSGLHSLQQAYNQREVSIPMFIVGAAVVAALAGILVAFVLFNGA